MKAKDLMVEGPNVVTIRADDSIYTAIRLMLKKGISGLPVVEGGPLETRRLIGVVTEGDLLRRRETNTMPRWPRWLEFLAGPGKLAEEYVRGNSRKIGDIMTAPAISVTEDTPVEDIVELMEQRHIKRVPVVRGETLIGIITRTNMLRALVREAGKMMVATASDAEIKERLLSELKKQSWGSPARFDVNVKEGIVELTGTIMDERQRSAIVVAAENVPGVRAIDDHMVLVELATGMAI